MLNKCSIMGRLTADPELRRTQTGTAVAGFTLAVESDYKAQDGSKQTFFIDCVAWRGTAEFLSNYFTKGRMVVVDGHIETRKWQDKEGNNRRSTEVIAEHVYFGGSKQAGAAAPATPAPAAPTAKAYEAIADDMQDDDFPF